MVSTGVRKCGNRQFTIMANEENTEIMSLPIEDLIKMEKEFYEQYQKLFEFGLNRLKRCLKVRLHAIKFCKDNIRLLNQ